MNVQMLQNLNVVSVLVDSLPFLKAVIFMIAMSALIDSLVNVAKLFKKDVIYHIREYRKRGKSKDWKPL